MLLAKQTAELDLLTGGRLRLGVGVGRNWIEYESLNADFKTRGRRMEEQVEVLRLLWSQELVTFDGEFHQLDRVGLNPRSVRPRIPIWMGSFVGSINERVLNRIGRVADGWMPQYPPDKLAPAMARLHQYATEAGRDPSEIGIECVMAAADGDSPEEWVDLAGRYRELGPPTSRCRCAPGSTRPKTGLEVMVRWHDAVRASLPAST